MYKSKTLLLACSLLSLLVSCADDPERHELTPAAGSLILYADQTSASLSFYTFDSWTVVPQDDWIAVDGESHADFAYDYSQRYLCTVPLILQPNTTGKTRQGTVRVQSYDYSYVSPVIQVGLLGVTHPAYTIDSSLPDYSSVPQEAHFELVDSAHWTSDSICFTVQNNWDLLFDGEKPSWLDLDKQTDVPGKYRVNLTLVPNEDTESGRQATLKLVSGKVSNEIIVRQLPAKKPTE